MTEGGAAGTLVVRFSPFSVNGLLDAAQDQADDDETAGRPPRWGISVWMGVPEPGESTEQWVVRALAGRSMNGKKMCVVEAVELEQAGFPVVQDEPPPNHGLILLRDDPGSADVEALTRVLDAHRMNNPMWSKGARS